MYQPLLISGMPRSGTTWIGEILRSAEGTRYLFEPDNEKISLAAWSFKQDSHRFPYLTAGDADKQYLQLWKIAFGHQSVCQPFFYLLQRYFQLQTEKVEAHIGEKTGFTYIDGSFQGVAPFGRVRPLSSRGATSLAVLATRLLKRPKNATVGDRLIVKSVHSLLALEWLERNFALDIVVVLRNPHSLYASYKRMKMPDGFRNILGQQQLWLNLAAYLDSKDAKATCIGDANGLQIAVMLKVLEKQIALHPKWLVISHDRLCANPGHEYQRIFQHLGLAWSTKTELALAVRNRAGQGFSPERLASAQPTKWRSELNQSEIDMINDWMKRLELSGFLEQYVY